MSRSYQALCSTLIAAVLLLVAACLPACSSDVGGPNRAPVARAGLDRRVSVGMTAQLDGTSSFDPDGQAITAYRWDLVSMPAGGDPARLVPGQTGTAELTPDVAGIWVVRLVVSDGQLDSAPDVVQVRAAGCQSDADCDDTDVCTGVETCQSGVCQPGNPLVCDDGVDCTLDSCDPQTGCQTSARPDGFECGARFCSGLDLMRQTCQAGECLGTALEQHCDDGNDCTDDTCDTQTGCDSNSNTAACDDGDPCSTLDSCVNGQCWTGPTDKDSDNDGYLDAQCPQGDDCDDQNDAVHPGTFEGSIDDPPCSDMIDNDCDGLTDAADRGCQGCEQDSDCDDANVCNGAETCVNPRCQPGAALACDDGNPCTSNRCDPLLGCQTTNRSDGVECGTRGCQDLEWTRQTCLYGACSDEIQLADCDGGAACHTYSCDPVAGCGSSQESDGSECGERSCFGTVWTRQTCLGGACSGSQLIQDCDDGNECTGDNCDPAAGCDNPVNEGDPCSGDGFTCTDDACDASGQCVSTELDANCVGGINGLCRPGCFSDTPDGCGTPPSSLDLNCTPLVDLTDEDSATCTATLNGGDNTGQNACLQCRSEIGVVLLDRTDFESDAVPGTCSLDGWTLMGTGQCYGDDDLCPMSNWGGKDCCTNFVCPIEDGSMIGTIAFQANKEECGNAQWHLRKIYDTTGVEDLKLCLDYAEWTSTNNEILRLSVNNISGLNSAELDCIVDGPRVDVDDRWFRLCYDLPAWANDLSQLVVHIYLHSNDNDDALFIDNITLRGTAIPCPAAREQVFAEDFSGCQDPLEDWNGWKVNNTNNALACKTEFNCYDTSKRIQADNASGSFMRNMYLTGLGDVELCFFYGDNRADGGESLEIQVDPSGGGVDWKPVYSLIGNAGPNNTCAPICVNLSDASPEINRQPSVGLKILMNSNGGKIDLDQLVITAARYCDGDGVIAFTDSGISSQPNEYNYSMTDEPGTQMAVDVFCGWDSPPSGQEVEGGDSTRYVP